jgi:cobalt-zinc-cadmium efflux system protein
MTEQEHVHRAGTAGGTHSHDHGELSDARLIFAVGLNLLLTVAEIVGGILSGSLALIADALHNFNDAAALVIAWVARRIARRKPDDRFTFGYRRAELIGAMVNLTTLVIVGLYLLWEAGNRLLNPEPIVGPWVVGVAGVALAVDVGTALLLWAMSKGNMNVYAAFVHNLSDAAASVAVLVGGALVWWKGWTWVDPLLTALIAGYILVMSVSMFRRTASILMENAPPHIDLDEVRELLCATDGVGDVTHFHLWELDEEYAAMEARVTVSRDLTVAETHEMGADLKKRLRDELKIDHATIEFEPHDR